MVDGVDLEAALIARLGLTGGSVVYDIVTDEDTGEDSDSYFSWAGCDCCQSGGASVYDVAVSAYYAGDTSVRETSAQICGACLCGLINGDWSSYD